MIVQCEQCMAKYRLDESRILGETATVKCSRCRHVFQVSKEKPSPPESPGLSFGERSEESIQAPFQCPNCGFQQPHSEECIKCGIIFSKYNATPRPRPPHAAGHGPGVDRLHERASMTYAGFGVRFAAHFIDGIIAGIMMKISMYLIMFPIAYSFSLNPQPAAVTPSLPLALVVSGLVGILLPSLYYILMWGRKGATLGKMAMKIKIVSTDGSDISYGTAFLRYIGTMISGILFGLGYLWMLWDDRSQTWHDKIASTLVIRTQ
jgi:predicted Zn finger-like uncharacterized protein